MQDKGVLPIVGNCNVFSQRFAEILTQFDL